MKKIFVFFTCCLLLCLKNTPDGGLFDDLVFQENKTKKINISVVFQSIGRNPFDMSLFSKGEETIRSHTALEFKYNDITYYLPIDNNAECTFLDTCKKGDTIYIDMIVFDSINTNASQRSGVKILYSYIVDIRQ